MTDWQQSADELRHILTSDPDVLAAWREGGVAAALRVVAEQRDDARQVARTHYRTARRCHVRQWGEENATIAYRMELEERPWLEEAPDG